MAFELVQTTTDVTRGSGRTTIQTGGGHNGSSSSSRTVGEETSSQTQTQVEEPVDVTEETSTSPNETTQTITREDRSIVVRFAIPFQSKEPVLPPGETAPSACP